MIKSVSGQLDKEFDYYKMKDIKIEREGNNEENEILKFLCWNVLSEAYIGFHLQNYKDYENSKIKARGASMVMN